MLYDVDHPLLINPTFVIDTTLKCVVVASRLLSHTNMPGYVRGNKNPLQDVGISEECGTIVKNPMEVVHVHLLPLTVISVSVGSTVLFLSDVCGGDAILLRRRVNSCPNWLRYSAGHEMKFDVGMKCFKISFFYKYFIYF